MNKIILIFFLTFFFIACQNGNNDKNNGKPEKEFTPGVVRHNVEAIVLTKTGFRQNIITNGIIRSAHTAELNFGIHGIIKKINVKNGDKVKRGDIIASLDNSEYVLAKEKAQEELNRAFNELKSLLLAFGGESGDTNSINRQLLQSLKSESGYNMALLNMKEAQLNLNKTVIKAPFDGIVANIEKQQNNETPFQKPFCKLFDNNDLIVEFSVTEQEIPLIQTGNPIKLYPIVYDTVIFYGKITEINPEVNNNGLIKLKAKLLSPFSQKLFVGMNVKVVIERFIPGVLKIPKSALIIRGGQKVVFTYNNKHAKWHYVETGGENINYYLITKGLFFNDTVIIKGNLNLAHDASVSLTQLHVKW